MRESRLSVRFVLAAALALAATLPVHAQAGRKLVAGTSDYPGRYPITRGDIDFVSGMISHHAQAIIMANWAPSHGASRSVGVLCARIVNAQTDEINIFQQWEKDRGLPITEAKPMPTKMMMNGVEHAMMMPGMLTDEQMKVLEASHGVDFDRNFLTFMIQHHGGAITMVNTLMESPGAAQDDAVYKFSSDIFADQSAEIERMQGMLANLPSR
ncbi:MAG: DUF305 domain-containing protein [Gemmatimonadetes bacterium]|nr:DUF305 domain-containing protein [Gemmatimonadota bacterium]